jgi:sporulation protein YlmC with PRC-barrel domain
MRHHDLSTGTGLRRDRRRGTEAAPVSRLAALDQYRAADGEPDVRGWHVLTSDGRRAGEVADLVVDLGGMQVSYVEVELDEDALRVCAAWHVLVPAGAAWLNEDEDIVRLAITTAQLIAAPAYDPDCFSTASERLLRRRYAKYLSHSDEDFALGSSRRPAGTVRICRRSETQTRGMSLPAVRERLPASAGRSARTGV